MKTLKNLYVLCTLLCLCNFTSCVLEFPDEGSSLVVVHTKLNFSLTWKNLEPDVIYPAVRKTGNNTVRRFVVEVFRKGVKQPIQKKIILPEGDYKEGIYHLPLTLALPAEELTVAVWADYSKTDSQGDDLYYDTSNLWSVSCKDPYTGCTDSRAVYYGMDALDLTPYANNKNAEITTEINMQRPHAYIRIIATDVEQFIAKVRSQSRAVNIHGQFNITFSYDYFLPTSFNMMTGKPCDSRSNMSFDNAVWLPEAYSECIIGSDYIFVNGSETNVILNIEIKDENNTIISYASSIKIPCRRGHITTVRGAFFTSDSHPGIGIDPDFEGDINIII